jgi:ubiquinone/menaquinone biosynthesis C-methylase UbiE
MAHASFDKTASLYNFVEKHIWEDYASACMLINEYLTLNHNETIIDVGGGTGLIAKVLRKKTPGSDIVVIDLSRGMLQKVNDPTLSLIQGDVTAFPLKDETFTLAILINTMHHIPVSKQQIALREVCRILKRQGRIFIIDIWFPNTFLSNLFVKMEKLLVGNTHHLIPDVMKQMVQDAGFQNVDVFPSKKNQYRYIATGIK